MDADGERSTLGRHPRGESGHEEVLQSLADVPFLDIGVAKIDTHRHIRTGQPEAIFGPGKAPDECARIAVALADAGSRPILVTRATRAQYLAVRAVLPEAVNHEAARLVVVHPVSDDGIGTTAIVSAGTADGAVAEEAARVAEALGLTVTRIADVGVAGIHRVLAYRSVLEEMDSVIVVAGMEGALPSVVAGLVSTPIVAVPTSVGYGATFGGLAALLAMLSSCAPGVVVVNVDGGFSAALAVHRILRRTR
jgi:NCAIR mutase (PurE)-related protein